MMSNKKYKTNIFESEVMFMHCDVKIITAGIDRIT